MYHERLDHIELIDFATIDAAPGKHAVDPTLQDGRESDPSRRKLKDQRICG
jgi:hypothetical protein